MARRVENVYKYREDVFSTGRRYETETSPYPAAR